MSADAPTHVICPDVPRLPEYLTAGKRYEVRDIQSHDDGDYSFYITANDGDPVGSYLKRSPHLNGADWIPVYADEESMVEAQSEEPKPSGVDRLLIVMGLGRGSDPFDLDALCDDAAAEINRLRKLYLKKFIRQDVWADVGPGLLEALEHLLAQVDEACGSVIPQGSFSHGKKRARAAIASAEKVESHE